MSCKNNPLAEEESVTIINIATDSRITLDSIIKGLKDLEYLNASTKSYNLSVTALEKGRMYLGELCHVLGKEYPYEKTKKATKPNEIQKAVDTSNKSYKIEGNEIQQLNKYREVIQEELDMLTPILCMIKDRCCTGINQFILSTNSSIIYEHIKDSRIWLGVRLGEIRDIS